MNYTRNSQPWKRHWAMYCKDAQLEPNVLRQPVSTRWNSMYGCLEDVLRMRVPIEQNIAVLLKSSVKSERPKVYPLEASCTCLFHRLLAPALTRTVVFSDRLGCFC